MHTNAFQALIKVGVMEKLIIIVVLYDGADPDSKVTEGVSL